MKEGARRVPQFGEVGQDLDPNVTAKPMNAAHEGDHKSLNLGRMAYRSSASDLGGRVAAHC
jgi:hypothetical protein